MDARAPALNFDSTQDLKLLMKFSGFRKVLHEFTVDKLGESGRFASRPGFTGFAHSRSSPSGTASKPYISLSLTVSRLKDLLLRDGFPQATQARSPIRFHTKSLQMETGTRLPLHGMFWASLAYAMGPVRLWKTRKTEMQRMKPRL